MPFFNKTFLTVFSGFALAFFMVMLYARFNLQELILKEIDHQTLSEARVIAHLFNTMPMADAKQISDIRLNNQHLSLFNAQGDLIDDSHIPYKDFSPAHNDADKPELQNAQTLGEGTHIRYDEAIKSYMVFAAVRLKNNNILRISTSSSGYMPLIESQPKVIIFILILIFSFSLLITYLLTKPLQRDLSQIKGIIEAIGLGEYQRRLSMLLNKEFTPLAEKINHMSIQIEGQIRTTEEQKEQLQSILDTMNEGVLVFGPNGGIRRYNKALSLMFPTIIHAIGRQVMEAIPVPTLQKAIEDIVQNNKNSTNDISNNPLQFTLASERVFSVHLARAGGNNQNFSAVAVFHDITSLVRLERVRSDFVANVSHELRTPLTAIQGYAETLAELDNMPENSRRFAEIIRKNGAYLARMVEELLALARLESGDVPMNIIATQAIDSINTAMALCRRQFDLQNIQVEIQVDDNLHIMSSTQDLTQIFRNLLENASRYAPFGSKVLIKALQDFHEKSMISFAVCDNGPGIPEPDQSRIFERFYRVEKHRSHASTGLGLAICKHTVERLGGQIWVESPTSEYATVFYFTIPTALGDVK